MATKKFWTETHASSATDDWASPQAIFDVLNLALGGFDLDVCASPENAKCPKFFTKEDDGLAQDWGTNTCWMNPPYGKEIGKWMQKAYESHLKGATVACLVPARTETKWWHDWAMLGEIGYIKGRLKFGNATAPAPFPSVIILFR